MVESARQQSRSEFLNGEHKNKLFVRFVFSVDFKGIEEFAVIYLLIAEKKTFEVVRFDCSSLEKVHAHYFFLKKRKQKKILHREKSFKTLLELTQNIRKNWRVYRLKFSEK